MTIVRLLRRKRRLKSFRRPVEIQRAIETAKRRAAKAKTSTSKSQFTSQAKDSQK